jgi:hypothetical protein
MEDFASTNAQYAPMLAWTGHASMGWNSWGKIQSNLSYIDESIAPLFPYQYAHTRRVAGDTYGSIEDTKREMASASYGWWMACIYNWNDPDEMLLEGTETPSGASTAVPLLQMRTRAESRRGQSLA